MEDSAIDVVGGEPVQRATITSSKVTGDRDRDRLEGDLAGLNGVRSVNIQPDRHTIEVVYDPTEINVNKIQEQIEASGYPIDNLAEGATQNSGGATT